MNKLLKKKMIIIPITLAFLILILYVSYAYYNAEVQGNESVSTVAVNGGFINIDYVNNSGTITAANIIPGWETTKSFTVSSSTNFTDPSLLNNTWYDVLLVVDQNDFVTGSLEYMLTIAEEDENKEGIYKNSEYYSIPTGTNLDGIVLGSGYLPDVNISHTYNLTLRYIDSDDIDQTTDMYAKFYARVNVRGSDIATITFDLDGGTLNNFSINEQSKSRIAKNTKVYIPVPIKENYVFACWEDANSKEICNNVITTSENEISVKALYAPSSPYEFDYTSGEQEFIAQYSGYYRLETWGGQGGSYDETYYGGYGAYVVGDIYFKKSDKVYINVAGAGLLSKGCGVSVAGGYNGGGQAGSVADTYVCDKRFFGSGGGATHIATSSGELSLLNNNKDLVIIVAGGGGGGYSFGSSSEGMMGYGGSGGGYKSGVGKQVYTTHVCTSWVCTYPTLSTQLQAGKVGNFIDTSGKTIITANNPAFGQGSSFNGVSVSSGGGGGYYGGSTGGQIYANGGVSYFKSSVINDGEMYCYNCETSDLESTKTYTTTCAEETPTKNCAKKGNGYARITYLHN